MFTKQNILDALNDKTKIVTYDDALVFRDAYEFDLNYVTAQGIWSDKWDNVDFSKIRIYQEIQ